MIREALSLCCVERCVAHGGLNGFFEIVDELLDWDGTGELREVVAVVGVSRREPSPQFREP